jgi:hypothetical protein
VGPVIAGVSLVEASVVGHGLTFPFTKHEPRSDGGKFYRAASRNATTKMAEPHSWNL